MSADRAAFAKAQAAMTAQWGENVMARGGDAEAYFESRQRAYLDRWREALRFVSDDAALLDLGGGNLFPGLLELLKSKRIDYSYLDIDPACVAGARWLAEQHGFKPEQFNEGFNDQLPHGDAQFEALFSSHCIEHSFDLDSTFREIRRVLKPDGVLLMAVPFGWERNPEHPYFFGPQEWIALLQDHGFRIRVAQIGCEYPEMGYDYFIAAQRLADAPATRRIDPLKFKKESYVFLDLAEDAFELSGNWHDRGDHVIGLDPSAEAMVELPAGAIEAWPVLVRHDWSGIATFRWEEVQTEYDLFSWTPFVQPAPLRRAHASAGPTLLSIKPARRSEAGFAAQAVLHGVLVKFDTPEHEAAARAIVRSTRKGPGVAARLKAKLAKLVKG